MQSQSILFNRCWLVSVCVLGPSSMTWVKFKRKNKSSSSIFFSYISFCGCKFPNTCPIVLLCACVCVCELLFMQAEGEEHHSKEEIRLLIA